MGSRKPMSKFKNDFSKNKSRKIIDQNKSKSTIVKDNNSFEVSNNQEDIVQFVDDLAKGKFEALRQSFMNLKENIEITKMDS